MDEDELEARYETLIVMREELRYGPQVIRVLDGEPHAMHLRAFLYWARHEPATREFPVRYRDGAISVRWCAGDCVQHLQSSFSFDEVRTGIISARVHGQLIALTGLVLEEQDTDEAIVSELYRQIPRAVSLEPHLNDLLGALLFPHRN